MKSFFEHDGAAGEPPVGVAWQSPAPAGDSWFVVDTPSCRELRDLVSASGDLARAKEFLEHYITISIQQPSLIDELDGLWIAAVTMYGRAYGTGVRTAGRLTTDRFDPSERDLHRSILNFRNMHVAHSVNGFEQSEVFAIVRRQADGSFGYYGIGHAHGRMAHLTVSKAREIISLCSRQLSEVQSRIDRLDAQVLAELASAPFAARPVSRMEFDTRVHRRRR